MVVSKNKSSGFPMAIPLFALVALGTLVLSQPSTPPSRPGEAMPMLGDPEAETYEWDYEIWAMDASEAMQKCRKVGNGQQLTEFLRVEQVSKRPSRYGDYVFKCRFKSEDFGEPYYVPSDRTAQPRN